MEAEDGNRKCDPKSPIIPPPPSPPPPPPAPPSPPPPPMPPHPRGPGYNLLTIRTICVLVCPSQPGVTLCRRFAEPLHRGGHVVPAPGETVIVNLSQYIAERRHYLQVVRLTYFHCQCWEPSLPYNHALDRFDRFVPVSDALRLVFDRLEPLCEVDAYVRANAIPWGNFAGNMLLEWERHEERIEVATFPRHGSLTAEQVEGTRQYGQRFFLKHRRMLATMREASPQFGELLWTFTSDYVSFGKMFRCLADLD
ncbi:hypothetical protein B0T25DRAFT_614629 [Lasiosphaeria hispida]|uniref:Uncharacterized protein n=1 Tax=Lasiosphaeria hispida TaxID=260671 RepID=A0AAJ0H815_9PEZI|nr:hypothetical protein B0T25DRAFT_614629 [Lasiosphaeria hispida]